jgi:glutaredoxin 3
MAPVTIYTTRFCPYCIRAKHLLDRKGVVYEEIHVDGNAELRREMMQRSGRHTVPQIWIGARHVGGCDDLYELERRGALDAALQAAAQPSQI